MFERLFASRTRVKLLKLFLIHQDDRYTLSSLAKNLKLQIVPLKKELDNLEKFGLISASVEILSEEGKDKPKNQEAKGEKKYGTDKNFILFEELKALFLKAQILYERDFIDNLLKIGRIKLLVLTGLFVNNPESVIDLLMVGNVNKGKLVKLIKDLEKELGREINFTYMETAEFIYRRNLTDVFLYEIMENKKIVVIDEIGF